MVNKSKKYGFSLIEIIVVLSIMSVLIAIGTNSYFGYSERARDDRRILDVGLLREALEKYYSNQQGGFYPTDLAELVNDGYLDKRPVDPQTGLQDAYQFFPLPLGCDNTTGNFCLQYRVVVELERKGSRYLLQSGDIRGDILP